MATRVGTPGGGRWVIVAGSMGNHGLPSEHPNHHYEVHHYRGSRSAEAETMMSLSYALTVEWVPEPIKAGVRELFKKAGIPT